MCQFPSLARVCFQPSMARCRTPSPIFSSPPPLICLFALTSDPSKLQAGKGAVRESLHFFCDTPSGVLSSLGSRVKRTVFLVWDASVAPWRPPIVLRRHLQFWECWPCPVQPADYTSPVFDKSLYRLSL